MTPPEQPAEAVEAERPSQRLGRWRRARAGRVAAGTGDAGAVADPDPVATPKLVVGKTPGVLADDSIAEAGRKVLRFHFARMLLREPGPRLGGDAEELHGMRVATRRQRAAWRIFGDGFRPRPDEASPVASSRGRGEAGRGP